MHATVSTQSYTERVFEMPYSAAFRRHALTGEGVWSLEACLLVALAARAGIALEEELLMV
jgi:hypothetical protein